MKEKFKNAEEIINRLHDLMKNHLESFSRESLPDIEKQSKERSIEVDRLMKSISRFIETAEGANEEDPVSMMLILNDRITTLLAQNKALEQKVRAFRDGIKNGMKQVSKGKKMISSYRSSTAVSNKPRVLSITN